MAITDTAIEQQAVLAVEETTQLDAAIGGVTQGFELLEADRLGLPPSLEAGQ